MQRSPLQSLDDALAQLLAQAQPLTQLQTLCTFEADGRVLAAGSPQEIVANTDVRRVYLGEHFRM